MKGYTYVLVTGNAMITYTFAVVVEQDEDARHAYCPALVGQGGATWGVPPVTRHWKAFASGSLSTQSSPGDAGL